MSSSKGRVVRWLGSLLLTDATVAALSRPAPDFRLVRLAVPDAVRSAVQPGDKLQILLPSDDVRTFTPFLHEGALAILGYVRAGSPAGRWLDALAVGDAVRFLGPQRSLRMAPGPLVLVGDATSLGVAASYDRARPGAVRTVLELGADIDATGALAAVGLQDAIVVRTPGAGTVDAIAAGATGAAIGITGGGALVQRVRADLRARGLPKPTVKAYWVEGRSGLD